MAMAMAAAGGVWLGSRRALGWLLLIVVAAAALRLYRLGAQSLWVDEIATLLVARQPLGEIHRAALQNDAFAPPLYFWLTHLITRAWGESEAALRAVSALAGVLTVPLVWRLSRELGAGERAAGLGAALLALNPLHLWYSQEARPYALLVALGAAALVCLAAALRAGAAWWWTGYALCGALALLTHPVAIVVPAIGLLWVLLSDRPRPALPRFLLWSAASVALASPILLALGRAMVHAEGTGSPARPITGLELPYTLFTLVAGYSFGPAVREIQDLGWSAAVRAHPAQTAIAAGVLVLGAAAVIRLRSRAAAGLAALLAVPILAAFSGAVITSKAYNVRYTVLALAGFAGLLGLALTQLGARQRIAAAGAVLAVLLWADLQWFLVSRYGKEDSRAAAACLRALGAETRVLVAPSYMASVLGHYAAREGGAASPVGLDDPVALAAGPRPGALLLTRLHHVPRAPDLVRAFERSGGGPLASATVPGYRILFNGTGAAAAAAACRAGT
jgi:mannosyltransferase